jgi:hypothetical protein
VRGTGTQGWARRPVVEAALVALFLAGVMAAAFGSHVTDGGFYSDDWPLAASEREHGYLGSVRETSEVYGSRPLLAVLATLPPQLFGADPRPQLVLALALGVVTAIAFYAVLRALGLAIVEAAAIAGLLVLFPWSDSTRLWISGSLLQASVIFYLLGVLAARHGLRASGRAAVAWHAGAATLYVASVLTYEAGGALALVTGAVYLRYVPFRPAVARWAVDVAAVGAAISYSAITTTKGTEPLSAQLENAVDMAHGAAALAANALFPVDVPHEIVALVVLAVVAAAAWVVARNGDSDLRRWLMVGGTAAVATGAGYAMFVPAAYWTPQQPGLENRVTSWRCSASSRSSTP